jgi:hypothetical protein
MPNEQRFQIMQDGPVDEIRNGDHLLGFECGHYWPGRANTDEEAIGVLEMFRVTGDSALCRRCKRQVRITGPVVKVLEV